MEIRAVFPEQEQGEQPRHEGGACKVKPQPRKPQLPECNDEKNREQQGDGQGDNGGGEGFPDRQQVALGGKGEPARRIGKRKQLQRAGAHREKCRVRARHKEQGNLGREQKDHDGGDDRDHEACRKAAFFEGADAGKASGSPVIADCRLEGIAHAVEQRLDKAVHIHEDPVYGNSGFSAEADKEQVHQDRRDAPRDIAQKIRRPAGNDLPDHAGAEMGTAETKLHFSPEKREKGEEDAECHAGAGGERGSPYLPEYG